MALPDDWHEQETRRLNKRSMRRALVACTVIVVLTWLLVSANLGR